MRTVAGAVLKYFMENPDRWVSKLEVANAIGHAKSPSLRLFMDDLDELGVLSGTLDTGRHPERMVYKFDCED